MNRIAKAKGAQLQIALYQKHLAIGYKVLSYQLVIELVGFD
jgi:hypothetical protein